MCVWIQTGNYSWHLLYGSVLKWDLLMIRKVGMHDIDIFKPIR